MPIIDARPHLEALLRVIISRAMLMGFPAKPVKMRSQKE